MWLCDGVILKCGKTICNVFTLPEKSDMKLLRERNTFNFLSGFFVPAGLRFAYGLYRFFSFYFPLPSVTGGRGKSRISATEKRCGYIVWFVEAPGCL